MSGKYYKSSVAISLYLALTVFILTRIGKYCPGCVENIYASALYPKLAQALAWFSNYFRFSIDDVLYAGLIIFLVLNLLLVMFRRLRFKRFLGRMVVLVATVYWVFNVLWGFNYYRQDINARLNMKSAKADVNELMEAFEWLVHKINASYTPIYAINKSDVLEHVQQGYQKQASFLKIDIAILRSRPKSISLSQLFGAATISGYYGPFFSEIHLNNYVLPLEYPQVLAHEMAHKLGVTSEAEANFYAWLVCSESDDKCLAYSANLYLLQYFVYECYKHEGFREVAKNIRYEVRHDFYKSHYHWMALMNRNVELVATKVNDAYLKSNNVEAGIDDYEGVVKHVMDYLLLEQESQ
ncbi:DUF3810 domain-containing protein [Carboxylicivirga sp. A043]|uniref:DUF3810 domain-containing protein n=1 Tax=Carboxylicivirga litoralis TaxID=2816963 RepID=UPI0021CB5A94|nr:DUF3810 domain-containing protein [Carboxylicivirga sp. A043]MCU4154528.1 DUF3810 domain-containing protein [Carboxylicivirga sp. A043]